MASVSHSIQSTRPQCIAAAKLGFLNRTWFLTGSNTNAAEFREDAVAGGVGGGDVT
jgi:hypothetical protein